MATLACAAARGCIEPPQRSIGDLTIGQRRANRRFAAIAADDASQTKFDRYQEETGRVNDEPL
jgi:hypothetical protein